VFFSINKLANNIFSYDFSDKRTKNFKLGRKRHLGWTVENVPACCTSPSAHYFTKSGSKGEKQVEQ
jgi:hypothetical protein